MSDQSEFSVADFFRLGSAAAAETVEQRIRMADAGIKQVIVEAPEQTRSEPA